MGLCLILSEFLSEGYAAELSSFGVHPKTAVPTAIVAPWINFRRSTMVCDYVIWMSVKYSNILPDEHYRYESLIED